MEIKEALTCAIEHEEGDRAAVATKLGVTPAMVSHYLNNNNLPSLKVAGNIWCAYGFVVEPFTERAVIKSGMAIKEE